MPKVIILCGIPASGKSTWTKNHISNNSWTTKSISRDDIRDQFFDQPYIYTKGTEDLVTNIFNEQLNSYINTGYNIILDNTHARERYLDGQLKLILENEEVQRKEYSVYIKFFDVPLWKAYYRAIIRKIKTGKDVPLKVIRDMHRNYKKIDRNKYKYREL